MSPDSYSDDPTPTQALLFTWLTADTPAGRQALLTNYSDMLTPELVDDLLDLAQAGPSYGGDRQNEARFQVQLLELAVAVAERTGATEALDLARRLLASSLAELPGNEEARAQVLADAVEDAQQAGRHEAAFKAQRDLAYLKQAGGKGREAMAAFERALDLSLADPALRPEAEDLLDALMRLALNTGRASQAAAALRRYVKAARGEGDRLSLGQASSLAGQHMLELGLADEARALFLEAAALLGEMGDDDALARAHLHSLGLSYATGDVIAATRHLEEVMRLRDRVTDPALIAEIDQQFGQFL